MRKRRLGFGEVPGGRSGRGDTKLGLPLPQHLVDLLLEDGGVGGLASAERLYLRTDWRPENISGGCCHPDLELLLENEGPKLEEAGPRDGGRLGWVARYGRGAVEGVRTSRWRTTPEEQKDGDRGGGWGGTGAALFWIEG